MEKTGTLAQFALSIGVLTAVVLVIFLYTRHAPQPHHKPGDNPVQVQITVDKDGTTYWNGKPISQQDLQARMAQMKNGSGQ
jgi:biopolymer transport protein ExbD